MHDWSRRFRFSRGLLLAAGVGLSGLVMPACLDRPVAPAEPRTSNAFAERMSQTTVDKIDLLFMIDNSASMADKQAILATAIPDLVNRLVRPDCVQLERPEGTKEDIVVDRAPPAADGSCAEGFSLEFNAIRDIHIGVITSSLGAHGADSCEPGNDKPTLDDHAHLLTRTLTKGTAPSWDGDAGFFQWDPDQRREPPGENDVERLVQTFGSVVQGAGQEGCGFEGSLEAFYRFLIDPNPSLGVTKPAALGQPAASFGLDDVLLQQRAEFLRPDSLVAVIVLSDENDCSTADTILPATVTRFDGEKESVPEGWDLSQNGQFPANYLMGQRQLSNGGAFRMRTGTEACADPSSPDCTDCLRDPNGPGCRAHLDEDDAIGLRCWDQRRRFGVDMLYPVQRYVDGLREAQVFDLRDPRSPEEIAGGAPRPPAALVDNPLFQDLPALRYRKLKADRDAGTIDEATFTAQTRRLGDAGTRTPLPPRGTDNVFFAAIIGVPWQDIAQNKDDLRQGYLPAEKVAWDLLRVTDGAPPRDPLMRESNEPRSGVSPVTEQAIGLDVENVVNGHEWRSRKEDLMYACRLPLAKPRACADTSCDCSHGNPKLPETVQPAADAAHNPLCQEGPGKPYGTTQYWAKAYPGSRFIEVMHRFQTGSIIASICTPNSTIPSDADGKPRADFGYRPAVDAIINRLKDQLTTKCTPRKLAVQPDGSTPCLVVDARLRSVPATAESPAEGPSAADISACRACDGPGRKPLSTSPTNVEALLRRNADVGAFACLCEVEQLSGDALAACTSAGPGVGPGEEIQGWCYVDNSKDGANDKSKLTENCPTHTTIRLATDTNESTFFITCLGAPLDSR